MNPFNRADPRHWYRFKGGLMDDNSSSNSTTNQTTNNTTDNRAQADNGSAIITGGATVGDITIESMDAKVAEAALANMYAVAGAGFKFADNAVQGVLDSATTSNRETLAASNKAISLASDAFKSAAAGESSELTATLKQIALGALITGGVLGSVYLYKRK